MDQGRIERSAWIPASRERVWQAISQRFVLALEYVLSILGYRFVAIVGKPLPK